jgi:hypothetical protein
MEIPLVKLIAAKMVGYLFGARVTREKSSEPSLQKQYIHGFFELFSGFEDLFLERAGDDGRAGAFRH